MRANDTALIPREALERLRQKIAKEAFVNEKEYEETSNGYRRGRWIFDIKRVLFDAEALDTVSSLLLERVEQDGSFQIGGIESAAIPLVAGILMKSKERGTPVHGFFVRKSRNKDGLAKMVEGMLGDERIVLVDDIMNRGRGFMKQVEVLESLGKKVDTVISVLRFRDLDYYTYFHERGIKVQSLLTLDDLKDCIDIHNIVDAPATPVPMPFSALWRFQSESPNFFHVVPKSAPVIDETLVYVGADNGSFWALRQSDGSVVWKHKVLFGAEGKKIFSSPALSADTVFFGAYDGNVYALDKTTGKTKWVFMEADWIGSSPCVSDGLGLVYIGLEFGLWKKQGGLAALEAKTGRKIWEYPMPGLTHSSPAYSKRHNVVVCGCNNGMVYACNAETGKLAWEFQADKDVLASFAFDERRGLVCFGSLDSHLYILKTKTGELVYTVKTNESIYSTPLVCGNFVYAASLDKNVYCINLDTGAIAWTFATDGRIFASPEVVGDSVYIGSNDGRLYELDATTGENTALFQTTERIVNKIAFNPETKKMFLPTFANEIYCITREKADK
jgi:outer membrane protein assembly factor BamB/orotate phosphoribosyltransferase